MIVSPQKHHTPIIVVLFYYKNKHQDEQDNQGKTQKNQQKIL